MVSGSLRIRRMMLVLGESSRWAIARALEDGGRCVTDLARTVGLSQSCTTRHLQALERERIVRGSRDGKRVIYALRLDDADVAGLLAIALRTQGASTPVPAAARSHEDPRGSQRAKRREPEVPPAEPESARQRIRGPGGSEPENEAPVSPKLEEAVSSAAHRIRSDIEDYLL